MKFSFYILSLFVLLSSQLMTEEIYASAKQFDIDYQRKHGTRIVPKNFRKKPLHHMIATLPNILGTGVGLEQNFYLRKIFQGDKLYIYESEKLQNPSQLGSNWQLELVHTLDIEQIEQKVKERIWHFKVTVLADSLGQLYATPVIYSFRFTKYPYADMLKLNPEERQELGKQAANHRKLIAARPGSLTENYPLQASAMLEAMENIPPHSLPIYGPSLSTVNSVVDVTQKLSQVTIGIPGEREHEKRKKQWQEARKLSVRITAPTTPAHTPTLPAPVLTPTATRDQQNSTPIETNDNSDKQ